MEPSFVWGYFIRVAFLLLLFYGLIKLLNKWASLYALSHRWNSRVKKLIQYLALYFIPFAILVLGVVFVGINPVLHTIFLVVVVALGYRHIQHYFNGILFRTNPLVDVGAHIIVDAYAGVIESFLSFGVILHTTDGERFVHYNKLEKNGFSITHKEDGALRQTIYILSDIERTQVLDLLFENPMVDFSKKPTIQRTNDLSYQELQLTLEKGVTVEDIILFLAHHDITSSLNKNKLTNGNI